MQTPDPPPAILTALAFLDDGESALSLERLTAVYLNATGALTFGLWPDRSRVAAEHRTIAARLARAAAAKALALHGAPLAALTGVPIPDTE